MLGLLRCSASFSSLCLHSFYQFHINRHCQSYMYMTNQDIPFHLLTSGDQFTNKEIRENQFYYVHDGSDNLTDVIRLTVEDGVNTVPLAVTVDVLKVDSHSPTPDPDATMTLLVTEGKLVSCLSQDDSNLKLTLEQVC